MTSADEELPPASDLELFQSGPANQVQEVARALQAAGIPSRIDSDPPGVPLAAGPGGRYGFEPASVAVYLREADMERAAAAMHEYHSQKLGVSAPEFGASLDACPACGAATQPGQESCTDCGLPFIIGIADCPRCGEAITDADVSCPQCGLALEGDP